MTYEEFSESLNDAQRAFLKDEIVKRLESAEKILTFLDGTDRDCKFYSFLTDAGETIKETSTYKNLLGDPELNKRHNECLRKFYEMWNG